MSHPDTLGLGLECYLYTGDAAGQAMSTTDPVLATTKIVLGLRAIGIQLVATGTLTGTWLIEASNDYSPGGAAVNGQVPTAGTWSDVTALFVTSFDGDAIANPAGSALTQYAFAWPGFKARALRISFDRASGTGNVQAIIAGGSA